MQEKTQHVSEIDRLRGIAIFCVILGHAIIVYPMNLHEIPWCRYLYGMIYTFHMPLFFFISGLCYRTQENYGIYILKKCKRLLLPYAVFGMIDILPRAFLPGLVNRSSSVGESIEAMLFRGGQYWFLYALFIIFMLFPLIEKIWVSESAVYISFSVLFAAGMISGYTTSLFTISSVLFHLPFFSAGVLIRRGRLSENSDSYRMKKG